jgi:hypothetical protein
VIDKQTSYDETKSNNNKRPTLPPTSATLATTIITIITIITTLEELYNNTPITRCANLAIVGLRE